MFDDMRRKLQSRNKINKPQRTKKSPQDITAGNNCRRGLKKLTRCKMGRKAWSILIVVSTVLYSFFMSLIGPSMSYVSSGPMQYLLMGLTGTYWTPILIPLIYLCVLLGFCCSKTGKCLLDKIWKKKKEVATETEKNEAGVNKESKKT
ncbi:hypothetical protein AK88_03339 [Plasmodium fragile]|uniref:Uncharacterized protein n=1 Tax=Plasmodium fragile TaxID=5857 RepID=A0A0D9QJA6_PLAFR|nr:uncharacterized protein AK88_03339 [Plasmodium fragile]KJP87053.1 hypothetical protein AK88_03339 [Plasmodium fragile]